MRQVYFICNRKSEIYVINSINTQDKKWESIDRFGMFCLVYVTDHKLLLVWFNVQEQRHFPNTRYTTMSCPKSELWTRFRSENQTTLFPRRCTHIEEAAFLFQGFCLDVPLYTKPWQISNSTFVGLYYLRLWYKKFILQYMI